MSAVPRALRKKCQQAGCTRRPIAAREPDVGGERIRMSTREVEGCSEAIK